MNYTFIYRPILRPSVDTISLVLVLSGAISVLGLRAQLMSVYVTIPFLIVLFPAALLLHRYPYPTWLVSITSPLVKGVYGIVSGLLIMAFVSAVHGLLRLEWMTLTELLQLSLPAIGLMVLLIVSIHGLHVLLYAYQKHILGESTPRDRLIFYLSSFIVITALVEGDIRHIVVSLLAYVIYTLLIDMFIEQRQTNLLWLIVWTIVLSSFLTLTVVSGQNDALLRKGLEAISLMSAFTVFSVTFILSGGLYVIYGLLNYKNSILPSEWNFNFGRRLHLRNRIQLSILATLIFSFITIGIVSVNHFQVLNPEVAGFDLTNGFSQALINAYVCLFLLGFAISISLSQYIRTPLVELGRTLKEVKLHKENRKISWGGNDEIGNLITEYNLMIDKLSANAQQLAEVERENAWREMAKQVAHEIKNPLTPMKLSLQYLQKVMDGDAEKAREMTSRTCDTLMTQIDNLQQIAEEFSNFGSLPKTANREVSLNEVVETIHDLFRNRQDMGIHLIEPIDEIRVYADKNQLLRVLNNLVKNSIQAIPETKKGYIELCLWKEDN
ncbi:MAG: histidine kinase dimerization/phospho-acceptor domain-containing protein, partial [Bacteroidota bacterium]